MWNVSSPSVVPLVVLARAAASIVCLLACICRFCGVRLLNDLKVIEQRMSARFTMRNFLSMGLGHMGAAAMLDRRVISAVVGFQA